MVPTTIRLPDDLAERLTEFCQANGSAKNRVTVLALRAWLAPAVALANVKPEHAGIAPTTCGYTADQLGHDDPRGSRCGGTRKQPSGVAVCRHRTGKPTTRPPVGTH
ncbi:MAG TPA: hypothetical protein VH816_07270 [Gaiellaceae bacterium]|jgi:hypothetical protein